jgi:hypothetical protein
MNPSERDARGPKEHEKTRVCLIVALIILASPPVPLPSRRERFVFPQFAQAILRMTTTPPRLRRGGWDFPQFAQPVLRIARD